MSHTSRTKLAAILFSDIEGYTAMMERNQVEAVQTVNHYKKILNKKVKDFGGEVINDYGDGNLSIFNSATDALRCAMEMQQIFRKNPPVPLRMGLHVGEIFFDNGQPLGTGVNIASRIESIGEAGTIFFSKNVYDKVRNLPEFKTKLLGTFEFKNIQDPILVYALANKGFPVPDSNSLSGKLKDKSKLTSKKLNVYLFTGILLLLMAFIWQWWRTREVSISDSISTNALEQIDKSIAVLPFKDMSEDGDQAYFGDGVADEILNALSQLNDLKVIGRTSSFSFKNKETSIGEIAKQLNVSTVLDGSVRKVGDKVRISAQLIRTSDESQLWNKTFDFKMDDIFAIQNEIALSIAEKFKLTLLEEQRDNLVIRTTTNQDAYDLYLKGVALFRNDPTNPEVEQYFKHAIRLDPYFGDAWEGLAYVKVWLAFGLVAEPKAGFARTLQLIEMAKNMNGKINFPSLEFAINTWHQWDWDELDKSIQKREYDDGKYSEHEYANYFSLIGDFEKAEYFRTLSLERDPLSTIFHYAKIRDLIFARKFNLALDGLNQLVQKFPSAGFHFMKADVYFYQGKYQESYDAIEAASTIYKDANRYPHFYEGLKIACLVYLNHKDKARDEMNTLLTKQDSEFVDPLILIIPLYLLGDQEEALDNLDLAYEKRSVLLSSANVSPYFDLIRNENRFQNILKLINFPAVIKN